MKSRPITILAVDDDQEDLHLMRRCLREISGYEIDLQTCETTACALESIPDTNADLLFLDYVLGNSTGLGILKDLRASGDTRPIIILTGQGDEQIAAECFTNGADDYIVKRNLNPSVLRRTIETTLQKHDLERQNILLEEELQEARKMESIATLAGGLAHDFNNLLTAMLGEAALADSRSSNERVKQHLGRIDVLGRQMAEQIRKLMDFSERKRRPTGYIGLRKVFDDLSIMLDHTIPKSIQVDVHFEGTDLYAFADESTLQQILMNLITNARDAIDRDGRITVRISKQSTMDAANAASQHESILIEVEDTGCGIDPAIQDRIFDPFFTTRNLSSRKGTGLGLALVWQLVEGYGGEIDFESTIGVGSCFRVSLPAGTAHGDENGHEEPEEPEGADLIMVVDDEEALRTVTCDLLEHLGYHTLAAGNGREAVESFEKHHKNTSLVLLDIAMPEMSGVECIEALRAIDDNVRVIFASGHDMEVREEELKGLGAVDVVQKPFQMQDLAQRIRTALSDTIAV